MPFCKAFNKFYLHPMTDEADGANASSKERLQYISDEVRKPYV